MKINSQHENKNSKMVQFMIQLFSDERLRADPKILEHGISICLEGHHTDSDKGKTLRKQWSTTGDRLRLSSQFFKSDYNYIFFPPKLCVLQKRLSVFVTSWFAVLFRFLPLEKFLSDSHQLYPSDTYCINVYDTDPSFHNPRREMGIRMRKMRKHSELVRTKVRKKKLNKK